jgi:hypothetical protein
MRRKAPRMTTQELKQIIIWYLENYWNVIATIANARNDVLFSGVMRETDVPVQTSTLSDVAANKAIKLTELDLDEMMDWIRVINDSYHYFQGQDQRKAKLLWLTYLEKNPKRKTKTEVMRQLFGDHKTFYRWFDEICNVIGLKAASRKLIEL